MVVRVDLGVQNLNAMKVGNVIKDMYGNIQVITGFRQPTNLIPYDYVDYRSYKSKNVSGGFRLVGYNATRTCGCYYDHAFRCYTASEPDEECEYCKGTGDEPIYRQGLNDCVLLADNVTEYKKMRLKEKIEKLQTKLNKLD